MSLDTIQLPEFLFQSMFKNTLVEARLEKSKLTSNKEKKIDFLGENKMKIIFLVKDDQSKYLDDAKMSFLNSLLKACRLSMADIALINLFQKDFTYQDLNAQLNAEKLLLFGISAEELDLPFQIPFFQIQKFEQKEYMLSPALEELQKNTELKKQLWSSFQKIFNLQSKK